MLVIGKWLVLSTSDEVIRNDPNGRWSALMSPQNTEPPYGHRTLTRSTEDITRSVRDATLLILIRLALAGSCMVIRVWPGVLMGVLVTFLGAVGAYIQLRQRSRPPTLELDPLGFTVQLQLHRHRSEWIDCTSVDSARRKPRGGLVVVSLRGGGRYHLAAAFGGLPAPELARLMESYRFTYGTMSEREQRARKGHEDLAETQEGSGSNP